MRAVVRWASLAGKVAIAVPLVMLVVLAMPIIIILTLLGLNKSSAGSDYVADYLERFLAGTEGGRDWDDFCSVPLKDKRLESIRQRVCAFEPPGELSDGERVELQRLLAEVRMKTDAEPVA